MSVSDLLHTVSSEPCTDNQGRLQLEAVQIVDVCLHGGDVIIDECSCERGTYN